MEKCLNILGGIYYLSQSHNITRNPNNSTEHQNCMLQKKHVPCFLSLLYLTNYSNYASHWLNSEL